MANEVQNHPTSNALARALDLHTLRILLAIDETASISAAGRKLGYTQPAITQHLQRAEARIGTQLVTRSARSIALTEAGALLARHAPRINAAITAAAAELTAQLGFSEGSVRLAAFPTAVASLLAPLLARLVHDFPSIEVEFQEAEPADALRLVSEGRSDIALHYRYASDTEDFQRSASDGLRARYLLSDEVITVVPRSLAESVDGPLALADLMDYPWIGGSATCTTQVGAIARDQDLDPTVHHDVTTIDAALALVSAGVGVAFVSRLSLAASRVPLNVASVEITPRVRRRIYATTLAEAANIPSVGVTLRLLAQLEVAPRAGEPELGDVIRRSRRFTSQRARFSAPPFAPPLMLTERKVSTSMRSTTSTLSRTAHVSAVAATALLLAGCTSPSTSESPASTQPDSITVALPGSLSNLYVGQESGILNYYIASIVQEGLVSIDAQGEMKPGLAKSWHQPNDVTYVYELRDNAKFQDGTPVSADDVVFSLDKARDATASPGLSYILSGVKSVTKTGPAEVTIVLSAPDAAFANTMSTGGSAFITSRPFWEKNKGAVGTATSLLLGSGPYKVTEFVPDSHISFDRVDTWWGTLPAVKHINVEFIPDESTRLLAAQRGDVDVAFNVPLNQTTEWEKLDTMRVDYANDLSYVGMYFNTTVAPFNDLHVREAFAHSVDREAIVDKILRGHGEVATTIVTPESLRGVYSADEARKMLASVPQYDFDLKAAKAALAESTYPDGFTTDLIYPSTGPQLGAAAESLAQNLAKIGITLNVREVPIEEWLASLDAGSSYGVGLMWYFSTLGDPAEVPSYMLNKGNISNYDDTKIQSLLSQAGAEHDPAARIKLVLEVEKLQAADVVNVPLWWGQSATAFSTKLKMDTYSSFAFISSWPTALHRAG